MPYIKTYPMQNSAILRINSERARINIAPEYQRRGEIWNLDKKQLLVDSILNDYDLPKLYFHALSRDQKVAAGGSFDYAIIDGRQRLETIWDFIEGKFALAKDFEYLADASVKASACSYIDLASAYPKLKIRFDSFGLPIMLVETDDLELIDDMFSRLNEAVPLNAAEKRNALGGAMAQVIRSVSLHRFFSEFVAFSDRRYQHREVAARLLYLEFSLDRHRKITDTKKPYLDGMVRTLAGERGASEILERRVTRILTAMTSIFDSTDALLRAQAAVPVYYLIVRAAASAGELGKVTREQMISFHEKLTLNKELAEHDLADAQFDFLQYDRLSQQGTNDAVSIKERYRILAGFLGLSQEEPVPHSG